MDPLSALGVASNIIQIVDFSSRIISRGHEIYKSVDGRLEDHAILDDAARNLSELSSDLSKYIKPSSLRLNAADKQLVALRKECEAVVKQLHEALEKARLKGDRQVWQSIHQALRSVWNQKQLSDLERRLDYIRKEIDTALLVSLRHSISELTKFQKADSRDPAWSPGDQTKQRHDELLNAIRENNWQPSRNGHSAGFSDQLQSATAVDLEMRFCETVLARLYFQHMPDRAESIKKAHQDTFEWIFRKQDPASDLASWDDFSDWLRRDDSSIYWITGKPGSGKSTLMKFLSEHSHLSCLLKKWAPDNLARAGFYFWNSGALIQKSRLGLLKTLLHTCLETRKGLILSLFPERWEQFVAFGGGRDPFDWPELRRAFKTMISDRSIKFFFLIDGLDEFDGEPKEIIDFIKETAQPNVKICAASRPWLPFEDAFKNRPSLLLEHITQKDILVYITSHFEENEFYLRLKNREPDKAFDLVQQVAKNSSGVFLWVYLVVESLLEGLSNSDRMSDLQTRLDALPSDLEALFDKLLSRLDPEYFKRACQMFRLIRAFRHIQINPDVPGGNPTLLEMYFADADDTKSGLQAPCELLSYHEAEEKSRDMRRRLNARCRGFLNVRKSGRTPGNFYGSVDYHIVYLHRTAKDFVESGEYWPVVLEATGHDLFDPDAHWANAFLWCVKTHPDAAQEDSAMDFRNRCVAQAFIIQQKTGIVPKVYLDLVFAARDKYPEHNLERFFSYGYDQVRMPEIELADYMTIVLDEVCDMDCKRIVQICKSCLTYLSESGNYGLRDSNEGRTYQRLKHVIRYYDTPRYKRWMRRRPALPPYE